MTVTLLKISCVYCTVIIVSYSILGQAMSRLQCETQTHHAGTKTKIKNQLYSSQSDSVSVSGRRSSVVGLIGSEDQGVTGLHMSLAGVMKG